MPDAVTNRARNRQKLQALLRELFQFDAAALDFGIYRIMNAKRDEVERFIQQDLLDVVGKALSRFLDADREELEAQLAQIRAQLGEAAFDETGAVRETFRPIPIAQQYTELRRQLEQLTVAEETEARVFNDLWRFFSRYYDQGDFLTERRYSSREAKYCVPYNGEEVMLHWANRDQYYVKTTEHFTDYRFTAGDYTVWFRLEQAAVPQDNVKGNSRYFVLHREQPLSYDAPSRTLAIPVAYRPLTDDEEAHYLGIYNAQQPASNRRKSLDRSVLCVALEAEILEAVENAGLRAALARVPEDAATSTLGRHLNRYTALNTMDYFVHKDLGGFLRRELDVFLKTEVLRLDDLVSDESGEVAQHLLTRMRVVRQIAQRIIDFLAQIEDFQKRLFEKRKFVVQTDYCVTLDRVPQELYPEILANEAQLESWRQLYAMDRWENDLFWQGKYDDAFLAHHPYLMIDTAFFDEDLKARLLASFEDLDVMIDGVLVHGENFQALNLLVCRFREQVKCIYIDPPYNSKTSEILYKNTYKHSSWLALMEDRLAVSRRLSTADGSHIVAIDENEQERLALLLTKLFPDHEKVCVAIRHNKKGIQGYYFSYNHDSAYFCLPPGLQETNEEEIPEADWDYANLRKWGSESERLTARNCFYPIYVQGDEIAGFGAVCEEDYHPGSSNVEIEDGTIAVYPIDPEGVERKWRYARDSVPAIRSALKVNVTRSGERQILKAKTTYRYKTMWTDERYIAGDHGTRVLTEMRLNPGENLYPKSIHTVRDSIYAVSDSESVVVDYFAGSGTTAHAVMNLNREDRGSRKYIMVEMGDYFDTVLKPRILKVAFSANWKDGVPQDRDGMSQMIKYQRIESYEDALNNIRVVQPGGGQLALLREFGDYMLHYMLDFETRESPTLLAQEAFERPFAYTLKIQRGQESPQDTVVDLVETFHYLIGMHVRRLERYEHQGRAYVVSRGDVRTERGIDKVVTIWRDTQGLDLEQEAAWVNAEVLTELVDRVYVNGYENFIEHAQPTEITFRQLMEAPVYGD